MSSNYSGLKAVELKEELKKRGLKVSGTKDEMIARLNESDKSGSSSSKKRKAEDQDVESDSIPTNQEPLKKGKQETKTDSKDCPDDYIIDNLKDPGWLKVLGDEFKKPYFKNIQKFLWKEKKDGKEIYPPIEEVFTAFNLTPFDKVKAVILGQDPYPGAGQGHGLSFSVKKGVAVPRSLSAMYKELSSDIPGFKAQKHGYLGKWAEEGVLMINATLTVEAGKANSHAKIGWLDFTDAVMKILNDQKKGIVFLLWGLFAQKRGRQIDGSKHHIIETPHPSPMAGGAFGGCKCFSKANKCLTDDGNKPIDWKLD